MSVGALVLVGMTIVGTGVNVSVFVGRGGINWPGVEINGAATVGEPNGVCVGRRVGVALTSPPMGVAVAGVSVRATVSGSSLRPLLPNVLATNNPAPTK